MFARPDWEDEVFRRSNLEKIFLTNNFDDPLERYDTARFKTPDSIANLVKAV